MLKTTIITLACCLLSLLGYSQNCYYCAFNQMVPFRASKTKMLVRFKIPQQSAQLQQIARHSHPKYQLKSLAYAQGMTSFKRQFKTPLASANPVYTSQKINTRLISP